MSTLIAGMVQGQQWSKARVGVLGVGKGPLKLYMAPENGGEFSGSLEVPRYWKVPFLGGRFVSFREGK